MLQGFGNGADHKIYFAEFNSYGLGVINYPDSLGASCHYVDQGYATDEEVTLGLPNTISGPVQIVAPPVADFQSSKTVICANDCINFTDLVLMQLHGNGALREQMIQQALYKILKPFVMQRQALIMSLSLHLMQEEMIRLRSQII